MQRDSIFKSIDWITIAIYLILIVFGWISICGAGYDYGDRDFFDFSTRAGKQFMWIICSFGLGFVLLMLDDRVYDFFAYIMYIGMLLLLIITIFIAPDTKGSRSWLILGPVSLQPAEFAKFATALALAKFMNSYNFTLFKIKNFSIILFIILFPILLIILQRETGSALRIFHFLLDALSRRDARSSTLFRHLRSYLFRNRHTLWYRNDGTYSHSHRSVCSHLADYLFFCLHDMDLSQAMEANTPHFMYYYCHTAYFFSHNHLHCPFQPDMGALWNQCSYHWILDISFHQQAPPKLFPHQFVCHWLHRFLVFRRVLLQ